MLFRSITTSATTAREAVGNSGTVDVVLVLEVEVGDEVDADVSHGRSRRISLYDIEHIPVECMQVEDNGENVPNPLLDHVMFPVGTEPVTAAKHAMDEPTTADAEEQPTEVVAMNRSEMTETVLSPALATKTSPLPES